MKLKDTNIYPEMLFNKWCVYWFDHTSDRRVITTNAKYEEIITHVIQPYFKTFTLANVDTAVIQVFLNNLRLKGLKASRVAMIRSILSAVMGFAVNHNLISHNPGVLARSLKRSRSEIHILNDYDIKQLINMQTESRYIPLILFTLFLGVRIGEALGLSWNKIDMDKGVVEISQQAVSYYYNGKTLQDIVPYTKDKNKRVLPLPEIAKDLLQKQKDLYVENPNKLVFTEEDGSQILYASFYYRFNKIMESIGRSDVAPHDLRHTMASTLLYKTKDILLLKEFLGHEAVSTTEFYPTATLQERQDTANMLDNYFATYVRKVFASEGNENLC